MKLKITSILLLCCSFAFAQTKSNSLSNQINSTAATNNSQNNVQVPATRTCGTTEYMQQRLNSNPKLKDNYNKVQEQMKTLINSGELANRNTAVVVTIPVVVHVVYNNTTQNISDAQINSQIAILNQDFRKLNTDITSVPAAFAGLTADCEIQFCLAQRDPQGNATTGITRTSTTHGPFYTENDVKYTVSGGHDAWNADNYLNIWVCDLSSGLLGYAQFPGDNPETDGVVVGYNYFGNTGAAQSPYNKGRTATHEVGHYFNLFHIWGDEPDCAADDEVTDTPQQRGENGGCPTFPLLSGSGRACTAGSPGAMFMNYMDYVNDACMYMFTNGQKVRVQAALNGPRASLITSNGCQPVSSGTLCDTVWNIPGTATVNNFSIFNTAQQTWGYVGGHNSYLDIGKAEKISNFPANYKVKGLYIGFAKMSAANSNSSFSVKIYGNGAGGAPGSALATLNSTYSSNIPIVVANQYSYFEFASPVTVPSSFFGGVEFSYAAGDTLAIYTTANNEVVANLGWEKISTGTWQPYSEPQPAGWASNISNYIAAVLCDPSVITSEIESIDSAIKLFPNPANTSVTLNISNSSNYIFKIYDAMGREIETKMLNTNGLINFDISDFNQGLYFVTGISNSGRFTKSFVVQK